VRQRCWAHVLREPRWLAPDGRMMDTLHRLLRTVYERGKALAGSNVGESRIAELELLVSDIAQDYTDNGCRFGAKLARAVPNPFTFLRHPHIEPTNNSAERMLRPIVISRKIHYGTRNEGGMRRFGTLMTCFLTWERKGQACQRCC